MLYPVKGEPIVRSETRGNWEYVFDTDDREHKYLHMNCDAVEENGYCVMCGAACPTMWTAEYSRPMNWPSI